MRFQTVELTLTIIRDISQNSTALNSFSKDDDLAMCLLCEYAVSCAISCVKKNLGQVDLGRVFWRCMERQGWKQATLEIMGNSETLLLFTAHILKYMEKEGVQSNQYGRKEGYILNNPCLKIALIFLSTAFLCEISTDSLMKQKTSVMKKRILILSAVKTTRIYSWA